MTATSIPRRRTGAEVFEFFSVIDADIASWFCTRSPSERLEAMTLLGHALCALDEADLQRRYAELRRRCDDMPAGSPGRESLARVLRMLDYEAERLYSLHPGGRSGG